MEYKEFIEVYETMLKDSSVVKVPNVPASGWLYCATCNIPMKVEKNGVVLVATNHHNATSTDKWKCPQCEYEIYKSEARWMH